MSFFPGYSVWENLPWHRDTLSRQTRQRGMDVLVGTYGREIVRSY